MSVTLSLPPETEKQLRERAVQSGQSVEGLALKLLEEALGANGSKTPTFDEILAPVRKGWEESSLSDDQVDELFDDTLKQVRGAKRQERP